MNFSVISEQEAKHKFKKANNKMSMLQIIADLTVSKIEETAEFLGVVLIDKYPWVEEIK